MEEESVSRVLAASSGDVLSTRVRHFVQLSVFEALVVDSEK